MTQERLTPDQEREVDRLLALSNLQRLRKQWAEAEDTLRRVVNIAPKDVVVREMLGDVLHECGKLDQALDEYQMGMELSPGKASLEMKYAKVALEIGERERERALAKDMLENPGRYTIRPRKPLAAFVAAFVPGLGQLYNGETVKACVIFGVFFLFVLVTAAIQKYPPGMRSLAEMVSLTQPLVLVLGFIAFAAYLYGLIDAPLSAEKRGKSDSKVRELLSE